MRNSRTQPLLTFKMLQQPFNLILSSNPTRSSRATSTIILAVVGQRWNPGSAVQVDSSTWRAGSSERKAFLRISSGLDKLRVHGLRWREAGLPQLDSGSLFPARVLNMVFDRINGLMSDQALKKQLARQLA